LPSSHSSSNYLRLARLCTVVCDIKRLLVSLRRPVSELKRTCRRVQAMSAIVLNDVCFRGQSGHAEFMSTRPRLPTHCLGCQRGRFGNVVNVAKYIRISKP
jgi:hypothetical protein